MNRDLEADREVGIRVPAHVERQDHVFAEIELGDELPLSTGEAMVDAEDGVPVAGVERDRASRLGGRMDIHTGQGTGTELTMSVPLRSKGKE